MEVHKWGPGIRVSDAFITEAYEDGLPEAESLLCEAQEKDDELFVAIMQDIVDGMKQWIEEHGGK